MPYKDKKNQKAAASKHYHNNKLIYKQRALDHNKEARSRNKNYVREYLSTHPCVDCGEKDVIVLEFDHVRGEKSSDISRAVNAGWSLERIKQEIEKCEVRCANCHRRITHKRNNAGCEKLVISVGS